MTTKTAELLESIEKVIKAIDDVLDWFIVYKDETDPAKKKFYAAMHESKENKLMQIAKEEGEKYE